MINKINNKNYKSLLMRYKTVQDKDMRSTTKAYTR